MIEAELKSGNSKKAWDMAENMHKTYKLNPNLTTYVNLFRAASTSYELDKATNTLREMDQRWCSQVVEEYQPTNCSLSII